MKKVVATLVICLLSSAFALADTSHSSLSRVKANHHKVTRHHAHKATKHTAPKRRHTV